MCYYPVTRMACGHHEDFRIALRCPIATETFPYYHLSKEVAATTEDSQISNEVCQRSGRQLSIQGEGEACSGLMCGTCQVVTGEILDELVRDVKNAGSKSDERWIMSGGLDADGVNIAPENTMGDLVPDLDEVIAGGDRMMSDRAINNVEELWCDSDYTVKGCLGRGLINEEMELDRLPRQNQECFPTECIMGWVREGESHIEAVEGSELAKEFLSPISRPSTPLESAECTSCKGLERKGTLINLQENTYPLPTCDQSYTARH